MTDLARGSRAQRREALPRRTAMGANVPRPSDFGTQSSAPAQGFFSGFMTEETEVDDTKNWLKNTEMHITLGGGYEGVKIFMTGKNFGGPLKWSKTDIEGVLRLIQITEVENYPVVLIQMMGTDSAGFERATVFEFELPFNFSFDGNLGSNFSALALSKCDYVGFFFPDRTGKADFDSKILDLKTKLTASSK